MKRKRPSSLPKVIAPVQKPVKRKHPDPEWWSWWKTKKAPKKRVTVESHLYKDWWKHPVFDFGLHYPCPYIWFGYWLITWEDDGVWGRGLWEDAFTVNKYFFRHRYVKYLKNIPAFRFIRISISFMPD